MCIAIGIICTDFNSKVKYFDDMHSNMLWYIRAYSSFSVSTPQLFHKLLPTFEESGSGDLDCEQLRLVHSKNRIVILTSGLLFEFQHITCMDTKWSRMLPLPTSTWFHLLKHIRL